MDFLNAVLTFPGRLSAYFLSDHFSLFSFLFFGLIIVAFALGLLYKKKDFFHITLILCSVLLAFIPFTFKFASYDSKLFWVFITLSAAIGFFYYFIDKKNNDTIASDYSENSTHENIPDSQEQPTTHPFDRTTRFLCQNSWLVLAIFIFVLAFYLRTFQIEKYPAGYSYWELLSSLDLVKYDEGKLGLGSYLSLFKTAQVNGSNESPIIMGLAIPFHKIFGISMVSARYFSILWGMVGLIFFFLYLREHFPIKSAVFLFSFTSLELSNVIFARTGFIFITAFAYAAFVLYLLEITFKQKKLYFSVLLAFLLGLAVFGSNYVYLAAKATILIVIVILVYKILSRRGFFIQYIIPLAVFSLTFSLAVLFYTHGDITKIWPHYGNPEYVNIEQGVSTTQFIKKIFVVWGAHFSSAFNKIVFTERAVDSFSKYKDGGLLSGPTLCLIPFAIGFVLAGIRRERYFSIIVMILVASLPALLGEISARRLLLMLSLSLILPGITAYLLFDQTEKTLPEKLKRFPALIPGVFFLFLFSYNLYIFIDINNKMNKKHFAAIPFAESGFNDITYSKATTALAKEIKRWVRQSNVFFYYSDTYSENWANPNGTYEQFLIDSYASLKEGGKLVWMNPFKWSWWSWRPPAANEIYFYKFETALKMTLDSDRDVKFIFIKPLADEMVIYEKLKALFPQSKVEEQIGDTEGDKFYVLSIPHSEIDQINRHQLVFSGDKTINEFNGRTISSLVKENINTDFSFASYFLLENDSKILFKNNVTGLLEITIDDYKLDEQTKDLTLLKGVHRLKIKTVDKELLSVINASPTKKIQDFSAPFIPAYKAMKISESKPAEFYPYQWSLKTSVPYHQTSPHAFYYDESGQYVYSLYQQLYNASGQLLNPDNVYHIIKILKKEDKTYIIQSPGSSLDSGFLGVYDSNYKKIKEIPLDGYPFDLFFGSSGELYITYLNKEKIMIVQPDYSVETWDTSSFSMFPIWNGDIDNKGDIILLSGDGQVFVLNKNKELKNHFNVDASWNANVDSVRVGGGVVISNGIIHIFDAQENLIKSYNKNGDRLYSSSGPALFKIPSNFKIDHMQKLNDKIILAGQPEIIIYQYDNTKVTADQMSASLLQFESSEVSVGYSKFSINSGPGLLQKVNNERYDNFIFAHAASHVTYHLRGLFQSLSIGYGLDDVGGKDRGSAKFIIKGDGKMLYTSKVMYAFTPIENVKVDVRGIDKLELVVDPTEDGNTSDESVWINPVLHARSDNKLQQ